MGLSMHMQQALRVLQMPIDALYTWLQDTITQNPFLEWTETPIHPPLHDNIPSSAPSLFSHLMQQAKISVNQARTLSIIEWIVGNLDTSGLCSTSRQECPLLPSEQEWKECLTIIQSFDPPGIGAESLQESLLLQLASRNQQSSILYRIIQDDFSMLQKENYKKLQEKYHLSQQEQKKIYQQLYSLTPHPGAMFPSSCSLPLPIDIIVSLEEISPVEIVPVPLPKIKPIPNTLVSLEEIELCKQLHMQAKLTLQIIKKRNTTLHAIASYLIHTQKAFLEGSSSTLRPIHMQTIAHALQMHESTIARAIAHKHILSPRGVLPLKSLLSRTLIQEISCDAAQKLLQKLIQEENRSIPLSDQELCVKMQNLGVPCSRRTITKYRKTLRIPSSRQRKLLTNMCRNYTSQLHHI